MHKKGGKNIMISHYFNSCFIIYKIDSLQSVGCFALTELGYGNNAVEMETTAEYDGKTDEFVVHTSTTLAQK